VALGAAADTGKLKPATRSVPVRLGRNHRIHCGRRRAASASTALVTAFIGITVPVELDEQALAKLSGEC
jgi:hypothetical protein